MPTLKGGYHLADGTRVPGVTTVLGRFKDSGALIRWAYNCGRDGVDMDAAKERAANAGTLAHQWIDDHIHGRDLAESTLDEAQTRQARNAFDQFLVWRERYDLRILETEVPLVSEIYRFGGTFDAVTVDGKPAILDWKTSNAIYSDYLVQCAAYALLWEERRGQPIDDAHILRVSKDHADFEHRSFAGLSVQKQQFVLYAQAYALDKITSKRVR